MSRSDVRKFVVASNFFPKAIFNRGKASKHLVNPCILQAKLRLEN
jgi:hypothetical protein